MTDQTESPLSGPSPHSLDELFASDPLGLTKEDWDTVVDAYREQRARLEATGSNRGGRTKVVAAPSVPEKSAGDILDDLFN